jgi:tetratricopeptide (TPR) repeat protein
MVWHGGSVLLLFGLWHRLSGAKGRSFLVAALFALHPMHVESVAWAAERKDVLSVFFGILTLWTYLYYLEKPNGKRYLLLMTTFLLSLLSKPMLVTLPFVLLLLDYWPLHRVLPIRSLLVEKVPLFVLAAVVGLVTLLILERSEVLVSWTTLPLSARLANAVSAYGWCLERTFWPQNLAVLYAHPYRHWSLLPVVVGSGMLLAITLLAVWQARRRRWLIVGCLWFVIALMPVLGLAQGGEQAWADRFNYWPHLGLFVAVVWGLTELVERLHIPIWACGGGVVFALGCLGVLTWRQLGYWRDTPTLWERAVAVTADNDVAHVHLGYYYLHRYRPDKAAAHFAEAVRIRPDSPDYHYFLGAVLLSLGKAEEAATQFQAAVERQPHHPDAWYNLGMARLRQGNSRQAIRCFREVLLVRPDSADALTGLGLALWRDGQRQQAVDAFQSALRINPQQTEAQRGLYEASLKNAP